MIMLVLVTVAILHDYVRWLAHIFLYFLPYLLKSLKHWMVLDEYEGIHIMHVYMHSWMYAWCAAVFYILAFGNCFVRYLLCVSFPCLPSCKEDLSHVIFSLYRTWAGLYLICLYITSCCRISIYHIILVI